MITRKKVIGAKVETTQGTAVALTSTDFIYALDIQVDPEAELLPRDYNSTSLDPFAQLVGKKYYACKFKTPLLPSGSLGVAPNISPLLQACGMTETISAGVSVTYAPTSAAVANFYGPGKSCTIKVYEDGILHVIAGAMGNPKFVLEAGKIPMIEWDFKGVYVAVTDVAFPANTPQSTYPPIMKSATLSLQGYAATVQKFEIDFGNVVTEKPDINAANSLLGFQITDRKPAGSTDPESTLVATHDFYGKFISGAEASSSIVIGSGAGNICTITLPKTQYGKITKADRGGIMVYNTPLMFNRNTGDDWISIVFT
jgi:hypothetical protein